ncbi:MAG: HAD-IIIA family hydrolase [Candidatus Kapaibacterium sp.]
MRRKAFFFDRDGIVNRRIHCGYVTTPDEFEFLQEFLPLFRLVHERGYFTAIITNQQGIGKGLMSDVDLSDVHNYMQNKINELTGYSFDALYYCSDLANTNSPRRKPNPGMLLEAMNDYALDPAASIMIGDSLSDAVAGKSAGCTTILIGDYARADIPEADYIFPTLRECYVFLESYLQ